jgi:hypothetical protein
MPKLDRESSSAGGGGDAEIDFVVDHRLAAFAIREGCRSPGARREMEEFREAPRQPARTPRCGSD